MFKIVNDLSEQLKTKPIEKGNSGEIESNGYHGGRREESRRREGGGSRLREERVDENNGRREEGGEDMGEKGEKNLSRKWKNTLASVSAVEKMR